MKTKHRRIKIDKNVDLEKLLRYLIYKNLTKEEIDTLNKTIEDGIDKDFSNYDDYIRYDL